MAVRCSHPCARAVWYEPMGEKRMECRRCGEFLPVAFVNRLRGGRPMNMSEWRSMFLDYVEGIISEAPSIELLDDEEQDRALAFVASHEACRGINPYAERPSIESLLSSRPRASGSRTGGGSQWGR